MRCIILLLLFSTNLIGQTDLRNWFENNIDNLVHFEGSSLQTITTFADGHVIQMYNNEADASMIIVKHHFSYGLGNDILTASGASGPTSQNGGGIASISAFQSDTVIFNSVSAGLISSCNTNHASRINTIDLFPAGLSSSTAIPCISKSNPLPITYSNPLEATQKQNSMNLTWSVATQINNDKYIIEHSKDGKDFSPIGEIDGDGTSNITKHYEYIHTSPSIGMNFYRIKQVDYDGKYSYSDIASVRYDGSGETSIYPNPASSEVTVEVSEPLEV